MTIRLSDYGAHLEDPTIARQLAQGLLGNGGSKLDFTGVERLTEEFATLLFSDLIQQRRLRGVREVLLLPTIGESVRGSLMQILRKLDADHGRPVRPTPEPEETTQPPAPEVEPPPEETRERYTPSRLYERLKQKLQAYLESAYPLKDPRLIEARKALLQVPPVIAQEPYVETTPRYATRERYAKLNIPALAKTLLSEMADASKFARPDGGPLLFDPPYGHQSSALESFLTHGKDLIVATGTGSGKTECFLLPILARLAEEAVSRPTSFQQRAVRALVLYPMNALVNDQVSRLRVLFGHPALGARIQQAAGRPIQFAMYTSRTPYPGMREDGKDQNRVKPLIENYLNGRLSQRRAELEAKGRWPAKDLDGFYGRRGQRWRDRLRTQSGDRELLTRHEVQATPPDLLVTNYSMLEYMLMRPIERSIFDQTRAWLAQDPANQLVLVLDEAHMYRGARGAEVGLLIRRLLARLGLESSPHKVRVICTSASLGSDKDAPKKVARFCADLTGKHPDDFAFITGARESFDPTNDRTEGLADLLASLSLPDLHDAEVSLAVSAEPLFKRLGLPGEHPEAELYQAFRELPECRELLSHTAGKAVSLEALAQSLFGPHEKARYATEVLLTLGTLARLGPDQPGLFPARTHLFYRGIPGVFACLNESCSGRQGSPGQPATAGKLFLESRTHCDACGSRVLELASCRECGSTYFKARLLSEDPPEFLWSDELASLIEVELLAEPPTDASRAEEFRVDLLTGYLNSSQPGARSRSLWMSRHQERGREVEFSTCPVCLSLARKPVLDLRTKGEQSFTALVETMFAEQPPQIKSTREFPNAGRKVLCFSDGRQKAARLVPAIEQNHMRDTFRQLLCLAAERVGEELRRPPTLDRVYTGVLKTVAEQRLALSERLYKDTVLLNDLSLARDLNLISLVGATDPQRHAPGYAHLLYQEVCDRYYSLPPLGLGSYIEAPSVWTQLKCRPLPDLGWSEDQFLTFLRLWIRVQLERRCFRALGVSLYDLGREDQIWPEGIEIRKEGQWLPRKVNRYLQALALGDEDMALLLEWLQAHVSGTKLLYSEQQKYYIDELGLQLDLSREGWHLCQRCNRLHRFFLENLCPDCCGAMHPLEDRQEAVESRRGYYRQQVERALKREGIEPFGLFAAEHSAQLATQGDFEDLARTEEYELRFQDILLDDTEPPVDVLSCTTTMEVGIDIGTLSAVALHNVPPHVSNYQQRAGRAGRRGRGVAGVITFAQGGTHDAYFFQKPDLIITGDVQPPVVYIENREISVRHARAFVLQTFFHETVPSTGSPQLFATLGTIREFLAPGPCSLAALESWLQGHGAGARQRLLAWLPKTSHWLGEEIPESLREDIADEATLKLPDRIREVLPLDQFARYQELTQSERDRLDLLLDATLLQHLIERAVLPRYAFPTDVVSLHIFEPRERNKPPKYKYQPQRDLRIALSEYAPAAELTIDKYLYTVRALYSPFQANPREPLEHASYHISCVANKDGCGFVTVSPEPSDLIVCPVCNGELDCQVFVRPPGFAPDVNQEAKLDKGGSSHRSGFATRARMEVPLDSGPGNWKPGPVLQLQTRHDTVPLISVNKGIQNRGFLMCRLCGCIDPVEGPGYPRGVLHQAGRRGKQGDNTHNHPIQRGDVCTGDLAPPFYLGHRFITDVLVLRVEMAPPLTCDTRRPAVRAALTTLSEALLQAASRVLQIDEGEMEANWSPVQASVGRYVDLYLYDVLPGGAGFARESQERLEEVLKATGELLAPASCSCEASCYRCLRNYTNQFYHGMLDRGLGYDLLSYIMTGAVPALAPDKEELALTGLCQALALHGIPAALRQTAEGLEGPITVPLVAGQGDATLWVAAHHPLVERALSEHWLDEAGLMLAQPVHLADAYQAEHQLPLAFEELRRALSP
ncbi:MAG: DEAD/DEAH box helicase [Candidatus Xenobia bacterium]